MSEMTKQLADELYEAIASDFGIQYDDDTMSSGWFYSESQEAWIRFDFKGDK